MQVSNVRRALVFNLFIAVISRSNAIKCASKVTFTKEGEAEKTLGEDEVITCKDSYTHCVTASGSFKAEGEPECSFLTNFALNVEVFFIYAFILLNCMGWYGDRNSYLSVLYKPKII